MSPDDFYVGYQPQAPQSLGRFVRRVVVALVLVGSGVAVLLALAQGPFDPGYFEFGVVRDFEGRILEEPVPVLVVARPGRPAADQGASSRFLLVSPGKFGARDLVAGFDGKTVSARGSLIYRGGETMIELEPGSIREVSPRSPLTAELTGLDLGAHTFAGEIVDSKCYLGVMKPGRQKTHRACAARCISGGIPPMLRVDIDNGEPVHLLLVGAGGEPINREILDLVAEPVRVSGQVRRLGDQLVIYIDPASIRRLEG